MKKIAIVTYNRVGEGQYPNGSVQGKDIRVYFAQNGHKAKWTASSECSDDIKERARRNTAIEVANSLELKDMDHVYLYVGNTGGEEMILQTAKIPQNRISYVMCGCNTSYKTRLIAQSGRNNPSIIGCECGGRETLADIASKLLRGEKA